MLFLVSSGEFPFVDLRDTAFAVAQIVSTLTGDFQVPELRLTGPSSVFASNAATRLLQSQPGGEYMDILAQLKAARDKAAFELGRLEAAVSALSGASRSIKTTNTRRKMSASARRKISLAQKARWAKQNNGQADLRPKRHVSAASRRKMAMAQRARWARFNQRKAA